MYFNHTFGLLVQESILDSSGHDIFVEKNITQSACYGCYVLSFCFITHLHSGFILVHSGFVEFIHRHNGVHTSMTLDAAKWNGAWGELSSCVINNIPLYIIGL